MYNNFQFDTMIYEYKIPTPFVKWVGGKRSIANELITLLPKEFNTYYEPMVGGGAVFYKMSPIINNAVLSDINPELIITYQVVKNDIDKLIKKLKEHEKNHCKDYYYKIREQHYFENPIDTAARFVYLNKTCYNGLYRTNKNGKFNVPIGAYKNPTINQEENLKACSIALQKATILCTSFEYIFPSTNDFVYFDPPYYSTFDKYSKYGFTEKDQYKLYNFFVSLDKLGVYCMLSNSNTPFILELYKNYNITVIEAPRKINCKSDKRNIVKELVIKNY